MTQEEHNEIRELMKTLKTRKVDGDTAVMLSLMVRKGDKRARLMQWMDEHPTANEIEICRKASELHKMR